MKNYFKHYLNYVAVIIALASFIIGTICLLLFKTSSDTGIVGIGYWFTLSAGLINAIMLTLVLVHGIFRFKDYKEHIRTILIVLTNIPITYLYIGIVIF